MATSAPDLRLDFPGGSRDPVTLADGATVIGSAPDCDLVLDGVGVAPHHCRIERRGDGAMLEVVDAEANTAVNGRHAQGRVPLQVGDVVVVGRVGCVLVGASARDTARGSNAASGARTTAEAAPAGAAATQIRGVLPRLVLRGVSGPTLGRGFPVRDGMVFGRDSDCDVAIESQEVSRHHARLHVAGTSVRIEDLDSTNGTFVNGQRTTTAVLAPGDELAFDNVRFKLIEPGAEVAAPTTPAPQPGDWREGLPLVAVVVIGVIALALVWFWFHGGIG